MPEIKTMEKIDHIAIVVTNINHAVKWYTDNHDCKVNYQDNSWAELQFDNINGTVILGPLYIFFYFLFFIPSLALYVRRLHDINRSGWWLLIVLIPFIGLITLIFFFCLKGSKNRNDFGEMPT